MLRQIIKIDSDKCNGCGLCVTACHEGAIGLSDGKAVLLRDDYCDGLGNCLPVCPTGAISFEEREALAYNEEEVERKMREREEAGKAHGHQHVHGAGHGGGHGGGAEHGGGHEAGHGHGHGAPGFQGCPGSMARAIERQAAPQLASEPTQASDAAPASAPTSQLRQWPVQIKLVPVNAPYFSGAHLLVAADCAAYAYGNFHQEYMRNRIAIIGCPKLDEGDYSEKLTAILQANDIKSVTVVRMEVPCCGGIEHAVKTALGQCGKMIPWQVVTLTTDGRVRED